MKGCLVQFVVHNYRCVLVFGVLMFMMGTCQTADKSYKATIPTSEIIVDEMRGEFNLDLQHLDSLLYQGKGRTLTDSVNIRIAQFWVYWNLFDSDKYDAILYNQLIPVFEQEKNRINMPEQYATFLHLKGNYLQTTLNFKQAYHDFAMARLIRRDLNIDCGEYEYARPISMLLFQQQRYDLSLGFFKRIAEEVDQCQVPHSIFHVKQGAINNVGIAFFRNGQPDSALYYHDLAMAYVQEHSDSIDTRLHQGVILGNRARALEAMGMYREAEEAFKASIELNWRPNADISHAVLMMTRLSGMLLGQKRFEEGKKWLDTAKPLISLTTRSEIYPIWNEAMWRYYDGIGARDSAYAYLRQHVHLSDSVNAVKGVMFEADIFDAYNRLEYDSMIGKMERDRLTNQAYLGAAIILVLTLSVVALLIYKNWISSRRHVAELEDLNTQITNQKISLQKLVDDLELLDEEKNRILWMVAHDLRNPIGAIASLSRLMLEEDADEKLRSECARQIHIASDSSMAMIKDILQVAGAKSLKPTGLELQETDICSLTRDTVDLFRFKASAKDVHLTCTKPERAVLLALDSGQIARALGNLIDNAIKFSTAGSTVYIEVQEKEDGARLVVRDEGIGIPETAREALFKIFSSARRNGTSGEQAFGLGLYITKRVVDAHGGNVWFESADGQGTVFYIDLLISAAAQGSAEFA